MGRRLTDAIFIGGILLVLLAGLGRAIFLPRAVNAYENRYANQLPAFTAAGVLDGTYQQGVDDALSDQVHLSTTCKQLYNDVSSRFLNRVLEPLWGKLEWQCVNYLGMRVLGPDHHIIYYTRVLSDIASALEEKAENYNRTVSRYPETDFYLYFIEKDTDIDFIADQKPGTYEYLQERLTLAPDHIGRFPVNSFEEFSQWFYRTDHHWNHIGSYRGYLQVLELLGVEDAPLAPLEEIELPHTFTGSKAVGLGADSLSEPFSAYRFAFPPLTVTINGVPAEDYGRQAYFLSGAAETPTYSKFYGGDDGEIIFSTGQNDRENLLIIGESFDNAILKLLASHFNTTYSVDLRYYEPCMGENFSLGRYLAQHEIDKVLLIGNVDYYVMPEFMLEG